MERGYILWEGKSLLDGNEIVLIATMQTTNPKTGNLIQTWILCKDVSPIEAINTGEDFAICGDCPFRGQLVEVDRKVTNKGRGCYVHVSNAPHQIYKGYENGAYPYYDKRKHSGLFLDRKLRLGAYGDPVAVPLHVWMHWLRLVDGHTGYTHQWKKSKFSRWSRYLMASTHTIAEKNFANKKGWRSFRVMADDDEPDANEIHCPASEAMNYMRTCETCMSCNGCRNGNIRRNIAIYAHGGNKKVSAERYVLSLVA